MKNKFLNFMAIALSAVLLPVSVVYADNSADYVHVDVLGAVYYGTLSDSSDGKSTIFTTVPESDLQFTITGKWDESASAFTQSCTIQYSDGSSQSVEYNKKGLIQGDVRTDFSDGSYQTFSAASGKPYKALRTFSSSDELTAIDWYYKCTLMSTWKSDADTVDYDTLMETPYEYIDLPFTVKGTVEAIYEDSNNHTDIKIKDDDGNVYLFYYQSEDVNNFASANIPSLSEGDRLSITGIFSSIQDPETSDMHLYEHMTGSDYSLDSLKENMQNSDFIDALDKLSKKDDQDESTSALLKMSEVNDPDLEEPFPLFNSVTAEVVGNDCDPMKLTNTYQEICQNPFYYIDSDITLDGTVVYEDFDADASKLTLLVSEKNTSNVYAVTYEAQNFNSILNKELHITGKLSNTHRVPYYNDEKKSLGYVTYPLITASSVE
ncbi:OB-fold nucleic acid binding domain-containing protein [Blautia obeum]|uniref:OB-fold nucleic acid binding domain-containing protein n=1 Tax=Blautia obeum TaxID=40520 RepID=UPI000E4B7901|nr:OB-fold nucleic acid binding domain-containing protein [Blautia obeum]RHC84824.1 hypothetical protein DW827_05275 [Blautia obeum]